MDFVVNLESVMALIGLGRLPLLGLEIPMSHPSSEEGPSTQYSTTLVPNTIKRMVDFGTRIPQHIGYLGLCKAEPCMPQELKGRLGLRNAQTIAESRRVQVRIYVISAQSHRKDS